MRVGRSEEAVELFSECIQVLSRQSDAPSQTRNRSFRLALLHLNLGHLFRERGERHSASAEMDAAWTEISKANLESTELHENSTAELYPMLIAALLQVASDEAADRKTEYRMLSIALDLANANAKSNADKMAAHYDVCICQLALGAWSVQEKAIEQAKTWFEKAASGLHRLRLRCPSNVRLQSDHASALNNLGQTELESGNAQAALEAFESSQKILASLAKSTSDYTIQSNLGGVLNNLAMAHESLGHLASTRSCLVKAIEHQKLALKIAPDCKRCQEFLSEHESHLLRVTGDSPPSSDAKFPLNQ